MEPQDQAALASAIEVERGELGDFLDNMLRTRPWDEVALFAVGCC